MTIHKLRKLMNMSESELTAKMQVLEHKIQDADSIDNYFSLLGKYWELRDELKRRAS